MGDDDARVALGRPIGSRLAPDPIDDLMAGSAPPQTRMRERRRHRQADVVIVGAGLAGLVAAQKVTAAGRSVVVLEARHDRVGGRLESAVHAGHAVDLGGAWIGAGHSRAATLASELAIPTWRSHDEGEPVVIHDGRRMRGRGYKLRHALATLEGRRVSRTLDRLARGIDTASPWLSEHAAALDAQTLESWLAGAARLDRTRTTVGGTLTNLLGIEPRAVSLLHALFYLRSSGGMQAMLSDDGGAQQGLVEGGAQSLPNALAARLGDALELGAPVRRIEYGRGGGVRVESDALTVEAGAAIVALAPALAARIAYAPALPVDRDRLTHSMPHGDVMKSVALYPDAFWRRDGLSGEAWGHDLPFSFSYDMSGPDAAPGVLTMFFVGDRARTLRALTPAARRQALLAALECCFGAQAARPLAVLERDWAAEEWTRGAYCGYMPPGVWTGCGHALRTPVGPLAWAGTETATEHSGYMEGAIESGERAAAEVLAPQFAVAAAPAA
jgi:monoamine oxidase